MPADVKTKLVAGYVPGTGVLTPFGDIFEHAVSLYTGVSMKDLDALILWGGEDISPSLYNQKVSRSAAKSTPSNRDVFEWEMMREAVRYGKPIIGVCRGAQIACAFAGGSLVQHVDGHNSNRHTIRTIDGYDIEANTVHHQMMNPYNLPKEDYSLLAWTKTALSPVYVGENHEQVLKLDDGTPFSSKVEPEIIYFHKIKALCIQGHPEWMPNTRFAEYCVEKAKELMTAGTIYSPLDHAEPATI